MRLLVVGVLGATMLGLTGLAAGQASFTDRAGDDNPSPDITSVTVAERDGQSVEIRIAVANFPTLPANGWFNVWLDLDSNPQTGGAGDEALVRYRANGEVSFELWDGARYAQRDATGFTGRYEAGVLTLTIPKAAIGGISSFGVLVVGARSQNLSLVTEFISSDFAPDRGRSTWTGPTEATFTDPPADHDAAPDVTSVGVSDTADGWLRFSIATPNYPALPADSLLVVSLDVDNRVATGQAGVDALIVVDGGEVFLRRWAVARGEFVTRPATTRVRMRNARGVVTLEVHKGELGDLRRVGFAVAAMDINREAEVVVAADVAPDNGSFWRYRPTRTAAAFRLVAGAVTTTPSPVISGKRLTITTAVTRSDTKRAITSGTVTCDVRWSGKQVPATGRIRAGAGQCTLVVPPTARTVEGSMTVRSGGKSVKAAFRFPVRA